MYVCSDAACRTLWAVWLTGCKRCGGALHLAGDQQEDFDHPVLKRFPMRQALRQPAPATPTSRDSVEAWRASAVQLGHDPDVVAELTKAELRVLLSPPMVEV